MVLRKVIKLPLILVSLAMLLSFSHAQKLEIDVAHSEVGFSIKHMMISNVKGKFTKFDADIDFDIKSKTFKSLKANVDANSIDTGIQKRDDHLRSPDFFEVAKYPQINFVMTKYISKGDGGVMEGRLTMHGVTKTVKLNVDVNGVIKDFRGNTKVGFSLSGKVNRKDFGLNWNKVLEFGGVAVGEEVKIVIELETSAL